MTGRLADKVALVTGSTRGIGRAVALRFGAEGAAVMVTGRSADDGTAVVAEIERGGGRACFAQADLSIEHEITAVVDQAAEQFGRLDILVNNGAATDLVGPGGTDSRLTDLDTERWDDIIRGVTTTVMWSSKAAIPHLADAGGGAIVNISSAAGGRGVAGIAAYQAAKAGVDALTRSIAVDYAEQRVRANTIVVGFVVTRPSHEAMLAHPEFGPALRAMHLTRLGRPDDIAAAALFLASDEAGFINGTSLVVDGGATSRMPAPNVRAVSRES